MDGWTQAAAGPYQAVPPPGPSWQPEGQPARRPHEYVRGGTAKPLTLFRPAGAQARLGSGELRAQPVLAAPNAVLHPWLQDELPQVLALLPPVHPVRSPEAERPPAAQWATWLGHEPRAPLPPLRLLLVWDNLAGHTSWAMVQWLFQHGDMFLYTPLSGSWLNMAESAQRIITGRALAGQHPETAEQVIEWLEDTVDGWNQAPTPFVWDGKRRERRHRARQRHLGGSAASLARPQLIEVLPRLSCPLLPLDLGAVT